jgi:hypothetical protein
MRSMSEGCPSGKREEIVRIVPTTSRMQAPALDQKATMTARLTVTLEELCTGCEFLTVSKVARVVRRCQQVHLEAASDRVIVAPVRPVLSWSLQSGWP